MLFGLLSDNIIFSVLEQAFYIFVLFKVFKKCDRKGWWAFIPAYREYQLAKCADREKDGRAYLFFALLELIFGFVFQYLFDDFENGEQVSVTQMLMLCLGLVTTAGSLIYQIRIYSGLIDLFGYQRGWLWLLVLVDNSVLLAVFGLSKAQPKFIYIDESQNKGAALSGLHASAMESGLTVNIEERVAVDFFKKKCLLRDIHLNVEPGHMVLLLGGSGAGKTTFLNAVNGYEKAKAEIILNGTNLYDEYGKMKYRIGFVPQMDLMRGNDTVERTLLDAARLRLPLDMSSKDRENRVDEALNFFGLMPVKKSLCDKLSGGQKKRLSIAMEYISNPDLFILDEPDSGLDGVMARELMSGLRKVADQGKIVMVITHSPDRVIDLFDDVIVLAKDSKLTGRLTFFGPVDEAKKFFGREKMEEIVLRINRKEEGGEGLADSFIEKYAEVCHG